MDYELCSITPAVGCFISWLVIICGVTCKDLSAVIEVVFDLRVMEIVPFKFCKFIIFLLNYEFI